MKIFAVTLFFFGFATAVINATGESGLFNGGSFLSHSGKYIPGKLDSVSVPNCVWPNWVKLTPMFDSSFEGSIPKIWGPLFEELIKLPPACARGFVKLMLKLLEDDDTSLKRNDLTSFALLFKIYRYIFEQLLPFIHHKRTHDVIAQIVDENTKYVAQSPDGSIDLKKVNEFFIKWSNDLNDSLNEWRGKHWKKTETNRMKFFDLYLIFVIGFNNWNLNKINTSCNIVSYLNQLEGEKYTFDFYSKFDWNKCYNWLWKKWISFREIRTDHFYPVLCWAFLLNFCPGTNLYCYSYRLKILWRIHWLFSNWYCRRAVEPIISVTTVCSYSLWTWT